MKYILIFICHNFNKNIGDDVVKRYKASISNELIRNRQSADENPKNILSTTEFRIILTLISLIKPNVQSFSKHEMPITDFCSFWNISYGGTQIKSLSEAIEKLCSEKFILKNNTVKWLDDDSYISNGIMYISLDDSLSEFLLNLNGNFSEIDLNTLLYLKSKHSIHIYLFLKSLKNQKFYNIKLNDAYIKFGDNKYQTKSQFDKNIIQKAIDEINEKTDITVTRKYKKNFGYPEMLIFKIRSKNEHNKTHMENSRHILDITVDDDSIKPNIITSNSFYYDESKLPF